MGVDGLLVEVVQPGTDLTLVKCDGEQGIVPDELASIVARAESETALRRELLSPVLAGPNLNLAGGDR